LKNNTDRNRKRSDNERQKILKQFTDIDSRPRSADNNNYTGKRTGIIVGNTAAGIGLGVATGLGAAIAAAFAEVTIPVLFTIKVFGATGGSLGLLRGLNKKLDN